MENLIAFPNLGLEFNINPVAFSIGDKPIYWYGIIIAFGFLLSALYASKRSPSFGLTEDNIMDSLFIAAPLGIICARIYYVAFSFDDYKDNLMDVFKIWEGGIAIYGGVIGGALGLYLYSKWKKLNFLSLIDIGACSLLLGQAIGRWGNFANAEAFGGETTSFLMMTFSGSKIGYHPTFLYESVWNIIGFALMYIISKKFYSFKGQMALVYMAWYGFGRGIIEGLRTDSLWWGNFRVSQVLGFATSLIGIALIIYIVKFKNKKGKNNDIA